MDHLCYLDFKEKEYEKLLRGEKTKLARGTGSKKPPYKHVFSGDRIFFVNEKLEIVLCGEVTAVMNVDKLNETEQKELMVKHIEDLKISQHKVKKLMRKNYLVLISLFDVKQVELRNYQNKGLIKRKKWILEGSLQFDKRSKL